MSVIGRLEVKNEKGGMKKTWLTIGIVICVVFILFDVLVLGSPLGLGVVASFIYVMNYRSTLGGKTLYKDVAVTVEEQDGHKVIELSNCEFRKGVAYSARYTISNDTDVHALYHVKPGLLQLRLVADKELCSQGNVALQVKKQSYFICLYMPMDAAKQISDELEIGLNIRE